ncbi:hypothetical protein MK489_11355 [Myxococcota bacterium]|nr:hypothetical protein [Myxococcota bacterium]
MKENDFETLASIANRRGTLLRVEQLTPRSTTERGLSALLLTFDLGRLLICVADPDEPNAVQGLAIRRINEPEDTPGGLNDAGEEEPWWRLLGAPLFRAEPGTTGLRLRFRSDADNPRQVNLRCDGPYVQVELVATSH